MRPTVTAHNRGRAGPGRLNRVTPKSSGPLIGVAHGGGKSSARGFCGFARESLARAGGVEATPEGVAKGSARIGESAGATAGPSGIPVGSHGCAHASGARGVASAMASPFATFAARSASFAMSILRAPACAPSGLVTIAPGLDAMNAVSSAGRPLPSRAAALRLLNLD